MKCRKCGKEIKQATETSNGVYVHSEYNPGCMFPGPSFTEAVKPNVKTDPTRNMEIAKIILQQLGGNKAIMMAGIYNPVAIDNGLQFNFKGSRKVNKCVVKLDWSDTYTFELWKITKKICKKVYSLEGVYEDMLIELFESETGLYLRL